ADLGMSPCLFVTPVRDSPTPPLGCLPDVRRSFRMSEEFPHPWPKPHHLLDIRDGVSRSATTTRRGGPPWLKSSADRSAHPRSDSSASRGRSPGLGSIAG